MSLSPFYQEILEQIDKLPDTAIIPVPVVALYDGTSRKSIKRNYPLIRISECREGVELGYLRRRRKAARRAAGKAAAQEAVT